MKEKRRGWVKWVAGTLAGVCLLAAPVWGGPPENTCGGHPWEGNPYIPPPPGGSSGGQGVVIIIKGGTPWLGVPYFWNVTLVKFQSASSLTTTQNRTEARVEKKAVR